MENRYLIYSTGTTYSDTIVRESAISGTTGSNEAELYSDFVIPEIQPLYFWRVTGETTVVVNTEPNINAYEESIALPHQSKDLITYGEATGLTDTKIDKIVGGVTGNIPVITSDGGLEDIGLNAADIILAGSGVTKTEFNIYTGATETLIETKLDIDAFETYSGATDTLIGSKLDIDAFETYTGDTDTLIGSKIDKVTGATSGDIATFVAGGDVQDSGKQFITTVNVDGVATDGNIPTELAVRTAINSAIASTIKLQGDWNATTNNPDITGTTKIGYAWRVSTSGHTNLGGITIWSVGDLAVKVAGAGNWMKIANEDIAAVWGNIGGTLSNQTDLQEALDAKLAEALFAVYTGVTDTFIKTKLDTALFAAYTGVTDTFIKTKLDTALFAAYTGVTDTFIKTKLDTNVFESFTASTSNINKKIQVVSTSTINANTVGITLIPWNSVPVSGDTYLWSGGTPVWIKSAGTYEVQYQIVLMNDSANQTHSVGGSLIKNNSITIPLTASAAMIVGSNAGGGLSLSPTVLAFEANDKLDLAVFRIGNPGNARLVSGVVHLMLNKIT